MPAQLPCQILSDGSVVIALEEACIETTARRVRKALADGYLEGRLAGQSIEGVIALLGDFLEGEDFCALRTEHPELAGGRPGRVRLWRDARGRARWELQAGMPSNREEMP